MATADTAGIRSWKPARVRGNVFVAAILFTIIVALAFSFRDNASLRAELANLIAQVNGNNGKDGLVARVTSLEKESPNLVESPPSETWKKDLDVSDKASPGNFIKVPDLEVAITTDGNPVDLRLGPTTYSFIRFVPDEYTAKVETKDGNEKKETRTHSYADIRILRDEEVIGMHTFGSDGIVYFPTSAFQVVDNKPPAGEHTYSVEVRLRVGKANITFANVNLVAREITK